MPVSCRSALVGCVELRCSQQSVSSGETGGGMAVLLLTTAPLLGLVSPNPAPQGDVSCQVLNSFIGATKRTFDNVECGLFTLYSIIQALTFSARARVLGRPHIRHSRGAERWVAAGPTAAQHPGIRLPFTLQAGAASMFTKSKPYDNSYHSNNFSDVLAAIFVTKMALQPRSETIG